MATHGANTWTFTHPDLRAEALAALLRGADFDVGSRRMLRRSLLDTFDGRLHAAGLRLECRHLAPVELILSDDGPINAQVALGHVPSRLADLPDGPFRARLAPVVDGRVLLPVFTVSERRSVAVRRDANGKTELTVVLHDQVSRNGNTPVDPRWAVEVEELEGYAKVARWARGMLGSLGFEECPQDLLLLAASDAGVDLRGYDSSPAVPLDRGEAAGEGFRRVLARLAEAIEANWAGTVDDVDAEFLHDLRVAVRRTRSVLTAARHVLPGEKRQWFRTEFGWLGSATGPARDLDVFVIEWPSYVEPLGPATAALLEPVLADIVGRRRGEHATLAGVLRSERYRVLIEEWRLGLANRPAPPDSPKYAGKQLGGVVADLVAGAQRHLQDRGRAIRRGSPAEELHALRKDAKKLRYLLECFGGVLATRPRKAFVQQLKALQDNLGEHQDAAVHAAQLLAFSRDLHRANETSTETLLAVGKLTEHLDRRRDAARQEFAQRFAAYDSKQTARPLHELLRSADGR